MEDFDEVDKVLRTLQEARDEVSFERDLYDFKRREVINHFWSEKIQQFLNLIETLHTIVHEKNDMWKLKTTLEYCFEKHKEYEEPSEGTLKYIEIALEIGKKYIPK